MLELENVPGAYDLDFLTMLTDLEALGIDGSIWKSQRVASLEPLRHLQRLKLLSLTNTRVESGGLSPLLSIKSLVHVCTALFYTAAEFASLRAELASARLWYSVQRRCHCKVRKEIIAEAELPDGITSVAGDASRP